MHEIFNALRDLDQPILIQKFGPKLVPYARIIYSVALIILALSVISSLSMLLLGNVIYFITAILMVIIEFIIVRMFCEYLITSIKQD